MLATVAVQKNKRSISCLVCLVSKGLFNMQILVWFCKSKYASSVSNLLERIKVSC